MTGTEDSAESSTSMECPSKRARLELKGKKRSSSEVLEKGAKRRRTLKKPRSIVGVIQRIQLKNFMCHDSLVVNLNERLNFITGSNGSGKSAILTGIILGLGGQAKDTKRADNMKELIKHGQNRATILLTLNNCGLRGYKKYVYGSSITIIRDIRQGSSNYHIKGETGVQHPLEKSELNRLKTFMGIQVENPLVLLTQEEAKSFLSSNSDTDMYKLYERGTLQDKVIRIIRVAIENLARSKNKLADAQWGNERRAVELTECTRRLERVKRLEEIKYRIVGLTYEYTWAVYHNAVAALEKLIAESNNTEKDKAKIENNIAREEKKLQTLQESISKNGELADILTTKFTEAEEKMSSFQKHLNVKIPIKRSTQDHRNQLNSKIKKTADELKNLKNEIARAQGGEMITQEEADRKKMDLEEKKGEVREKINVRQHCKQDQQKRKEKLASDVYKLQYNTNNQQKDKKAVEHNLVRAKNNLKEKEATKNQKGPLTKFPPWMTTLSRLIEQRKSEFKTKPVGPVGSFISLKPGHEKWALAVESVLGSCMTAFCADSSQDAVLLKCLMKQVIPPGQYCPTVFISPMRDTLYDTSRTHVYCREYCIVYDILDINNVVAGNCLIENANIHRTILFPNETQAKLMMCAENKVPKHCQRGFTITGDTYFPAPGYKTYFSKKKTATMLSTSDNIAGLMEEIQHLQRDIERRNEAITKEKLEINTMRNEERQVDAVLVEIEREIREFQIKLNDLENVVVPDPSTFSYMHEECNTMQDNITEMNNQLTAISVREEEIDNEIKGLESALKECKDEIENIKYAQLPPVKEQTRQQKVDVLSCNKALDKLRNELSIQVDHMNFYDEEKEKVENNIAEKRKDAESMHPDEIKTRRAPEVIFTESHTLRQRLANEKTNSAEVVKEYGCKRDEHTKCTEEYNRVSECVQKLKQMLMYRDREYEQTSRLWISAIQQVFKTYLDKNNFMGKVEIDKIQRTVTITVCPAGSLVGGSSGSLSGGERSFSTIAFLVSVWSVIKNPFCVLDEFDVFMDNMNRRISRDLLVNFTMTIGKGQYIFISPLDIGDMTPGREVSIFRMREPKRKEDEERC